MVFWKKGKWHLCSEKVRYDQHGEEITQYVGGEGHDWWIDFAKRWEHTEIIEFIPIDPTQEQLTRFEEVSELRIPEGVGTIVCDYVGKGTFPEYINHPLRLIQIKKESDASASYAIDLDYRLSSIELGLEG